MKLADDYDEMIASQWAQAFPDGAAIAVEVDGDGRALEPDPLLVAQALLEDEPDLSPDLMRIEARIDGKSVPLATRGCEHTGGAMAGMPMFATIREGENGDGPVVRREIGFRVLCTDCSSPFTFVAPDGMLRDQGHTLVVEVRPG